MIKTKSTFHTFCVKSKHLIMLVSESNASIFARTLETVTISVSRIL